MTERRIQKIDVVMLKYAFSGRRYMLDMVNRGVRSEFFADGADNVYRTLYELFTDSSVASVISQPLFLEHCRKIQRDEAADLAEKIFAKMSAVVTNEEDYTYHLKEFRKRYNAEIARKNVDALTAALDADLPADDVNELFKKSWNDIAALNRVEVFDEGSVGADAANMKAEYLAVEGNLHQFRGVTVGMPSLDNMTNGFQPGELIIIAGMEGTGKSLVMMNMGVNAWLGTNGIGKEFLASGKNILYFTLEMPRSNRGKFGTSGYLNRRIISCLAEIPFGDLRKSTLNAQERSRFLEAIEFIEEYDKHYKFHVIDIPRGASVEDIEIKFQELRERFPIDLVIVDYLGIMAGSSTKGGGDADWEAQGQIAAGLHEFARTYGVPVLTGVQLNRPSGAKGQMLKDQQYNNTRIGRSALIGQNANMVMMIGCRDQEENYLDMPLYLTKMRDGQKGVISLNKDFARMRVYDGPSSSEVRLDRFEDLVSAKDVPDPNPIEEDYTPSSSSNLDFGDDGDYSDYDF